MSTDPTEEQIDAAQARAVEEFELETVKHGLAASLANRYYVQLHEDGFASIGIGAVGVMISSREATLVPVSTVSAVFRVDTVLLRELAKTINELLPEEAADPQNG